MWSRGAVAVAVMCAVLTLPFVSGSESQPEIDDDVGDAAGTGADLGGAAVDIDAAWIDSEDLSVFNFVIKLGASLAPQQGETFTFVLHVLANGTDTPGTVTVTPGPATQASGSATGAFLAGTRLQLALSRPSLGSPVPGTNLTGLFVSSSYVGPAPVLTATDRAPNAAFGRDYIVGSLAPADQDYDGDTIGDRAELAAGTDPARRDSDSDGLDDAQEATLRTNATRADSDGDGVSDGQEVTDGTDPNASDSDGDGANDGAEAAAGTDPLLADSDDDGVSDGDELANATDPTQRDSDSDGLGDGQERVAGTNPNKADSDGDGHEDAYEIRKGTDPLDASDKPNASASGGSSNSTADGGEGKKSPGLAFALGGMSLLAAALIRQESLSRRKGR